MFYKKLKVDNESGRRGDAEIAEVSQRGTARPISFFLSVWPLVLRRLRDEALTHCGAALLVLIIVTPHTWAQKTAGRKPKTGSAKASPQASKEDAKKLAEAASQSRANLLSASNAYRESLEKLLELQRQDESRAATIVERRKELLARGVIEKRELEEGERALAEAQGKISETMRKIAEVDQLMAEVNAAEKMAAKKPAAKKAKKGSAK